MLSHGEVETLFHEFGHLLHLCLSKVEVRHQVGTNVAWDFVELPSQIMENWCWEKEALATFARHHETGAPIPDELLAKMQRARTYREATAMSRQLGFATVDLALHVDYDPQRDGDVLAYARAVAAPFVPAKLSENHAMIASFSHLFSSSVGYAAGYYSYKWAEVLDADAFTRFKREGVYNRQVGEAFRRSVLERGDSADPMQLYKDFMGREPSLDALMERAGLAAEPGPSGAPRVPGLPLGLPGLPFLGHGVGLRVPHYERRSRRSSDVDWVELVTENFFGGGGRPRAVLERLRRDLPLVFHGVSLGIGSPGAPDPSYLSQLKALADQYRAGVAERSPVLDGASGHVSHDLLPLPYTEEALRHVSANVSRVQDVLRRPLLLENVSSYVALRRVSSPSGSSCRRWRSARAA